MIFLSGLPRSGSTLLASILSQNPRFHVTGTSGLVDTLVAIRNGWDHLQEHRAMRPWESKAAKQRVLAAVIRNYHDRKARGEVVDKNRSWLAHLEMVQGLIGQPKVLVPVRDVRDILASMERLWRKASATRQIPYEARDYLRFQTVQGRMAAWMAQDGLVGIAFGRVMDAFQRGWGPSLWLVRYEDLCEQPQQTLDGIHDFLGVAPYHYDAGKVTNPIYENDEEYGIPQLHQVRSVVQRQDSQWESLLGEAAMPYNILNELLDRKYQEQVKSMTSHAQGNVAALAEGTAP